MLQKFVKKRLSSELDKIRKRRIKDSENKLNIYEEALIYHYTSYGYEQLNKDLRSKKSNNYEAYLNISLDKLPDFKGIVYRGLELTKSQIDDYKNAERNNERVSDLAFVSSSKSILIAKQYSKANTEVSIISKTGKEIEKYSYYDLKHPQNEQ